MPKPCANASFVALLILAAAGAAGAWWWQDRDGAAADRLTLYGNVEVREVSLAFNVPGRIAEMAVDEGDAVLAGAVLARLDHARYRAAVEAAEADLQAQQAVVAELEAGTRPEDVARAEAGGVDEARAATGRNAEIPYQRQQSLARSDFASREALDDARNRPRSRGPPSCAAPRRDLAAGPRRPPGRRRSPPPRARGRRPGRPASHRSRGPGRRRDRRAFPPPTGGPHPDPGARGRRHRRRGGAGYSMALIDPVWIRAYLAGDGAGAG